ncbi:MAG: DUF29 domain-containing protein [Caulobacterales bacterium]|nr:DUF29 domain-containing protein [Caulobacterales bacterium]
MADLYDTDAYTWALKQADALRRRSADEIDWDNVAEEIEAVARTEARALRSRYAVLLLHVLKWAYQPERRSRSWETSIKVQRIETRRHLAENPGLRPRVEELFTAGYETARLKASLKTERPVEIFPETSPFSVEQAMDEGFWPEAASGA